VPNALAEPPCSQTAPTEPVDSLADLSQRVAALEARLAWKRADSRDYADWIRRRYVQRRSRPDRCPFGWKPSPHDPMLLVQDPAEQATIWFLIVAAQNPALGPRALCRWLDSYGK
jgi:hypothetical protein